MSGLREIPITALKLERFALYLGEAEMKELLDAAAAVRAATRTRTIWNINSTEVGGGVAEMLPTLLGYAADIGLNVRWVVMDADLAFYAITKRIHNGLHGTLGDGGLLGTNERDHFEAVAKDNWMTLATQVRPGDIVIVHDPQPAAMIPLFLKAKARVIWRCHIGLDIPNELVHRSWQFLRPYIEGADAMCFTRASYAPNWVDPSRLVVIQPSIDPFVPKNQEMSPETVRAIVSHIGLIAYNDRRRLCDLYFRRIDGSEGQVIRHADILHAGCLPPADAPLVVQISRWDRLKDMVGVMRGFTDFVPDELGSYLALVGPNVHGVKDDPEGEVAYAQVVDVWRGLPHFKRCRVQIVTLPTADVDENAAIVNAIQRHATIVTQKSLAEGFGLTVSEAMWKGKPVVASAVGGIQDQIMDQQNGCLIHDPTNLEEFGTVLCALLKDPQRAANLGSVATESVKKAFLTNRHLIQFSDLLLIIIAEEKV